MNNSAPKRFRRIPAKSGKTGGFVFMLFRHWVVLDCNRSGNIKVKQKYPAIGSYACKERIGNNTVCYFSLLIIGTIVIISVRFQRGGYKVAAILLTVSFNAVKEVALVTPFTFILIILSLFLTMIS